MTSDRKDPISVQPRRNQSVILVDGSSLLAEGYGVSPIHFDDKCIGLKSFSLVSG